MEQHPGQRIAQIRAERGFNQSQLARLTGFTPAFISQIEGGNRLKRSSWVTLQKLANALGVTVDDLLPPAESDVTDRNTFTEDGEDNGRVADGDALPS